MSFSKEDKAAWENSEIMKELEKMAEGVFEGVPEEAHLPISEGLESDYDKSWEDEDTEEDEEALVEILEEEAAPTNGEEAEPTLEEEMIAEFEKETGSTPEEEGAGEFSEEEEDEFIGELAAAYNKNLLNNLEKFARRLADNSNVTAAYKVERVLQDIQSMLLEGKNAKS